MNNFAIKTTLAVLLASTPLVGAYAQPFSSQISPEDRVYSRSIDSVDTISTSSINRAASGYVGKSPADLTYEASISAQRLAPSLSLTQQLERQIKAAESNVNNARQNGYVDAGRVSQLRAQIDNIRQQAAGGVSNAAFHDLSQQLKAVNQGAYALVTG